ncbi:MAG TPA: GNAT family N-acetyltransferase [Solirubrobacteraceae bacterium]|nr:GNAT family N-acetyltransferase [Solirubrobacteraceae bacterium]
MSGPPERLRIVDADASDLPAMVAIYNEVLASSSAIFSDQPVTAAEMSARLDARRASGLPTIVAREAERVVGYASYGEFRPWPGYRSTVEHSVYVVAERRRGGVGRMLMVDLIRRARRAGLHAMIGAIDAENTPSLILHEGLGFRRVGLLPEVARKFDRWLDLALLQLML